MATLLARPELGPDTLSARPYQEAAVELARGQLAVARSTVIIHPTGLGKTVLAAKISRLVVDCGGRVLFLAHRGELIEQACATMERVGILAGVEKAGSRARAAFDPDVVVATVQTMQRERLRSWPRDHFRLVVVDEAHHATAESYRRVLKHFAGAKVLGITATPDRADEDAIASVFETVAHEMTIWDAMVAPHPGPYLSRLRFVQCDVGIDLRGIRTTGGDYNLADLEDRIGPLIETLANAVRQEVGVRPTLVFTPDVGSAQAMAAALRQMNVKADWVAGDSPDRRQKIGAYKQGDTQVLCNCALLTEGFDSPHTAAVVLCRPTKSRPLYAQMVGRGTRLHPGKEDCLLVDFNFLTEKHDLVRPGDLFDTTHTDPEELAAVDEILKAEPGVDLVDAVERAKKQHRERQVLAIRAKEREVRYRKVSYDPLDAARVLGLVFRGPGDASHSPATDRQVAALTKFGVTAAAGMSRRHASRLLDLLISRAKEGKATVKQVSWAIAKGCDPDEARGMTFHGASEFLDAAFHGRG